MSIRHCVEILVCYIHKEVWRMNRTETAATFIQNNMPQVSFLQDDQELQEVMKHYMFGDIYAHGSLSFEMREFITLAILTTQQGKDMIKDHVLALQAHGTPMEVIMEVFYHCIPYAGLVRVEEALTYVHEVVEHPSTASMSTVEEATRFEKGFEVQCVAFTKEAIQYNRDCASEDLIHIQDYLSAHCFGDFYTRKGLDLKQRELLTFCIIAALGGCESQLRGHTGGNLRVGNTREQLLDAITQCQPYIGFPRTLNAIHIINELAK